MGGSLAAAALALAALATLLVRPAFESGRPSVAQRNWESERPGQPHNELRLEEQQPTRGGVVAAVLGPTEGPAPASVNNEGSEAAKTWTHRVRAIFNQRILSSKLCGPSLGTDLSERFTLTGDGLLAPSFEAQATMSSGHQQSFGLLVGDGDPGSSVAGEKVMGETGGGSVPFGSIYTKLSEAVIAGIKTSATLEVTQGEGREATAALLGEGETDARSSLILSAPAEGASTSTARIGFERMPIVTAIEAMGVFASDPSCSDLARKLLGWIERGWRRKKGHDARRTEEEERYYARGPKAHAGGQRNGC